jgi:hypothetical protein
MTLIYSNSTDLATVLSVYGNISVFCIFYRIFILVNQWFIRYAMKKFNTIILKYNILCVNNFFGKKKLPYERRGGFKCGLCIIFNFLLFDNVSWTTNVKPYGRKKTWVIFSMYIGFIQSSLSNHWIKVNFDSKWTLNSKMLSCKL